MTPTSKEVVDLNTNNSFGRNADKYLSKLIDSHLRLLEANNAFKYFAKICRKRKSDSQQIINYKKEFRIERS